MREQDYSLKYKIFFLIVLLRPIPCPDESFQRHYIWEPFNYTRTAIVQIIFLFINLIISRDGMDIIFITSSGK